MITPLRKQNESDGEVYFRPAAVEDSLKLLYGLPVKEIARRAAISDENDPDYIRSECIVHFVRQSKANGDTAPYQALFLELRNRVMRAVPVRLRRISGMTVAGEIDSESQIQEEVLFHFQELLCLDRQDYDERLDFYEIRFNSAIVALRATARKSVWNKESRRQPAELDGAESDGDQDFEESLERVRNPNFQKKDDVLFRLIFLEAISSLPPEEREVIELILEGYPIDSKKPGVRTIAMILNCDEKTVRNRRNRARAALKALKLEEAV